MMTRYKIQRISRRTPQVVSGEPRTGFIAQLTNSSLALIAFIVSLTPLYALSEPIHETLIVPAKAAGIEWKVRTEVYRPQGFGPFPLVVFSHGRGEDIKAMKDPISKRHVNYWIQKGFAVIAPIRPGYGETGGDDIEHPHTRVNIQTHQCSNMPDYEGAAKNAADSVSDVIAWAREQPWAHHKKIILVGVSVGGLTSIALGARSVPGVIAYINFSGGHGGNPKESPGNSACPLALRWLFFRFGRTTQIPNLWLYSRNDMDWGEKMPRIWHEAFIDGGGRGGFVQTEPLRDEDGHYLLSRGEAHWIGRVDYFISALGFRSPESLY